MTVQVSFISLSWKSWRDMHDLAAVLDYEEGLPHAGSSAQRRHASARWRGDNGPFRFACTTVRNDEHQKVAALGAFERQHLVTCGNRGDGCDDPFDIASDALGLVIIHGVVP